jgi:sporulation protein YlmC with PRC-barrel domain
MGQFMTQMQPNQMMASKLIGTTVVGANNESIGDVNDVIVDRNGQVMAVVIGVGGFLGIGEKDVAVPFQQLDFVASQQMNQQTSGTTSGTGGAAGTNTSAGGTVSTTGSTATTGAGSTAATNANDSGVPDRVMLRMTKAELQAAPTFARSNRGSNAGTSGAGGGTTAPKP